MWSKRDRGRQSGSETENAHPVGRKEREKIDKEKQKNKGRETERLIGRHSVLPSSVCKVQTHGREGRKVEGKKKGLI